jgi:rod shape-determining protein MreC
MMRRGSQLRATSYLIIAVALALVLLSTARSVHLDGVRGFASTVFEPVQGFFTGIGNGARDFFDTVTSVGQVAEENRSLKRQIAQLQQQLTRAQSTDLTNQQLQALLDLRTSLNIHTVAATVIARDPEGISQSITVRAGTQQGVQKGMAALGPHGLVGRVVTVHRTTSQVMLVTDPNNPVNVMLGATHLPGTVMISQGKMSVQFPSAPTDLKIDTGAALVTSGIGGNYPNGLPVAAVVKYQYQAYSQAQVADVAPLDDLGRLEVVEIDLDFVPQLPIP